MAAADYPKGSLSMEVELKRETATAVRGSKSRESNQNLISLLFRVLETRNKKIRYYRGTGAEEIK